MKHKWKIKKRGKVTKYYDCETCGAHEIATTIKEADNFAGKCIKRSVN